DLEQAHCRVILAEAKYMQDQKSEVILKELEQARELVKDGSDSQVLLLARTMSDMAEVYQDIAKQSQNSEEQKIAEAYYKRALALMFRSPAREEARVLTILDRLTRMYVADGRNADVLALYKTVEQVDKSTKKMKGVIEDRRLIGSYFRDQHK